VRLDGADVVAAERPLDDVAVRQSATSAGDPLCGYLLDHALILVNRSALLLLRRGPELHQLLDRIQMGQRASWAFGGWDDVRLERL
jgi:hypothetical protein